MKAITPVNIPKNSNPSPKNVCVIFLMLPMEVNTTEVRNKIIP